MAAVGDNCRAPGLQPGGRVRLWDGTEVPYVEMRPAKASAGGGPLLVFGHGLTDRKEDDAPALQRALDMLGEMDPPPPASCVPATVVYDARGHGESSGWECCGPEQFHWRSLAADMLQVGSALQGPTAAGRDGVLLGGFSMGANSALWAALICPRVVRGLVLLSCTTAWELRSGRRAKLLENAEKKRLEDPARGELLLGAARADLPPKEELRSISVPALIVSARDDPVHPAAMAEQLAELLPDSRLVLVDSKAELHNAFSHALVSWLCERFVAPAAAGA
uniref:AB hydrolase-1 domain-containing protein n=1 Tax=Alexandrium monilatum TaxID=311494 RepID=A0A7S4UAP5_9DINO